MKLIVPSPDVLKAGNKNTSEESNPLTSELRSKRVSLFYLWKDFIIRKRAFI